MEPLDELTFTRAVEQMNAARAHTANSRLLDSAYFAGGMLADTDIAIGRVRSAAEVIEKALSSGASSIETLAAALAGYYQRLGSANGAAGLSLATTKAHSSGWYGQPYPSATLVFPPARCPLRYRPGPSTPSTTTACPAPGSGGTRPALSAPTPPLPTPPRRSLLIPPHHLVPTTTTTALGPAPRCRGEALAISPSALLTSISRRAPCCPH